MSFSFFKEPTAMTDATLTSWIDDLGNDKNKTSDQICELLIATRTFLAKTAPSADMRAMREKSQQDKDRQKILDDIGKALLNFAAKDNPKALAMYDSCKLTVMGRLQTMDKEDKINLHYQGHDNELKTLLLKSPPRQRR